MEKTYFDTYNKKMCNGCGTCSLVCPKKCIKMVKDDEGFLYPVINKNECIKCGKCRNVCSNFNNKIVDNEKAYGVLSNTSEHLELRSSGGVFILLAKYVINNGGIVFGVTYNNNLEVQHDYTENLDDVFKFSGSKYARSNLKNSYEKVKSFLQEDRYVLFTGTPCQISGLKKYLGKEYDKLILCDVICRANPSPKVFDMYLKNLEILNGKKIKKIFFRGKETGWRDANTIIEFEDGKKIIDRVFVTAFGQDLMNRPSCSKCVFVSKRRISDITIGDLWGIDELWPEIDFEHGVSLVIVNSTKGKRIFNEIKPNMKYKEVDYDKACSFNYFKRLPIYINRKKFFKLIKTEKINENNLIEMMDKFINLSIYRKIIRKIKKPFVRLNIYKK